MVKLSPSTVLVARRRALRGRLRMGRMAIPRIVVRIRSRLGESRVTVQDRGLVLDGGVSGTLMLGGM